MTMSRKQKLFTLERIAEFGDFVVFMRVKWRKALRLPLYLVGRESDGRDLEDFRRVDSAIKWALEQSGLALRRRECENIRMTTGGENKFDLIIDRGMVKRWVGIGWVSEGPASRDQRRTLPTLID